MTKKDSLHYVLFLALVYIAGIFAINLLRIVSENDERLVTLMLQFSLTGGAVIVLSCIIHLIAFNENNYFDCSAEKMLDSYNTESHGEYDVRNDTFYMNTMTWD